MTHLFIKQSLLRYIPFFFGGRLGYYTDLQPIPTYDAIDVVIEFLCLLAFVLLWVFFSQLFLEVKIQNQQYIQHSQIIRLHQFIMVKEKQLKMEIQSFYLFYLSQVLFSTYYLLFYNQQLIDFNTIYKQHLTMRDKYFHQLEKWFQFLNQQQYACLYSCHSDILE